MRRLSPRLHVAILVAAAVAALVGALAAGAAPRASQTRSALSDTQSRGAKLRSDIAGRSAQIETLQKSLTEADRELASITAKLRTSRRDAARLQRDLKRQSARLDRLERRLNRAERQLVERVVAIYRDGDMSVVTSMLAADSISEAFARQDIAQRVASSDKQVIEEVQQLEDDVRLAREQTSELHAKARAETATIDRSRREAMATRAQIADEQTALLTAVQAQRFELTSVDAREVLLEENLAELERASGRLQQTIQSQSPAPITSMSPLPPSPSPAATKQPSIPGSIGMAWPVSGPIVSPYGPRWGRVHSGIDIAAPAGTTLRAAAAGTVSYAGWMDGYGNIVVIQHASGLSTAYAHQSRIASSSGQSVEAGAVVGYVGCSGRCFGDHVHFETRINGSAVDPMNYL